MKSVAELSQEDRRDLFSETASVKGITAAAIEKDFWVCWILLHIFSDKRLKHVLRFKGGTSLSKCFNVIERFSEDIDLILDWTVITREDPEAERSKTKQGKLNKQINQDAQEYIRDVVLPALDECMAGTCTLEIDKHDGHTINVRYPMVFEDAYLRNEIRLEIGPLAHMLPFTSVAIVPYAAEIFPDVFSVSGVNVDTIIPERTFWEKVTILHAEAHRPDDKPQPKRYSRHYYDVYRMLNSDIEQAALKEKDLLGAVVAFKQKFYPASWANYDGAQSPTFKLIPSDNFLDNLRQDYEEMRDMIFGEYPEFDLMMSEIAAFQERLNKL